MKLKSQSIILAIIIIAAAAIMVFYIPSEEGAPGYAKNNKAAEGLTNFYLKLHENSNKEDNSFILQNDVNSAPLSQQLSSMPSIANDDKSNPDEGNIDGRFRPGDTLKQKIVEYASEKGVTVIWQLDKDFVVKQSFVVSESLLTTARKMASAIEGNFSRQLMVLYCDEQQALIFTEQASDQVRQQCQRVN